MLVKVKRMSPPGRNHLADTHEDLPIGHGDVREFDTQPGTLPATGADGEPAWVRAAREYLGVWQLDPARSYYEDGNPLRKSTQKIDFVDGRVVFRVESVLADGWDVSYVLSRIPDGIERPHPDPDVADIVSSRIVGHTFESVSHRAGRVIRRTVRTLSPDGRTLTVDQTGYTQFGEPFRNRSVYVKASP
jgi:hypothetical protein